MVGERWMETMVDPIVGCSRLEFGSVGWILEVTDVTGREMFETKSYLPAKTVWKPSVPDSITGPG